MATYDDRFKYTRISVAARRELEQKAALLDDAVKALAQLRTCHDYLSEHAKAGSKNCGAYQLGESILARAAALGVKP